MRFLTFEHAGRTRPGILRAEIVLPLACASLAEAIAAGPELREPSSESGIALAEVRVLAPLRPHKNVFCVGRNYLGHAEEVSKARGVPLKLPDVPTFFTKAPTAIADPEQTLRLDATISRQYDWEAELAVVIGKRCRDLDEDEALAAVFGYTCLNDVTARDVQQAHHQWFKGKSLDQTCPIGPLIVTADEAGDPQNLDVSLRVNGELKQHASTAQMIFSVAKIVASLSRGMTLEPGDVIATGTPEGVGFARTPPEFLVDGDVMEVAIAGIGTLRNRVAIA